MADRLTDEQLQRIAVGALVFPDVPRAMAAELLAARARITELGQRCDTIAAERFSTMPRFGETLARITELEASHRLAARCQATTVDPTNAGRPSCAWCVLPAGHQGMHRAELPQEHGPATLEWPSEVTE